MDDGSKHVDLAEERAKSEKNRQEEKITENDAGKSEKEKILRETGKEISSKSASKTVDGSAIKGTNGTGETMRGTSSEKATSRRPSKDERRKRSSGKRLGDKDFLVGKVLGTGAFSKVLQVRQKGKENCQYAMKIIEKKFVERHKKTAVVMMERNVLMRLSHPNVVKLHVAFRNEKFLFFGLDLCENGTLLDIIVSHRKDREASGIDDEACTLTDTKFYTLELVRVLEYIHGEGVIHRDLKPENILIKKNGHIMLADFGTAKDEHSKRRCNTFCGTAEYVSPEVLRDEEATAAADYWAVGCILYQLYIGRPPFRGHSDMGTFEMITNHRPKDGQREFAFPSRCGTQMRSVLDAIFCQNPKLRLCGRELRAHPFFFAKRKKSSCLAAIGILMSRCSSFARLNVADRSRPLVRVSAYVLCVDADKDILTARAPTLPKKLASRQLPEISDDAGSLSDFEIVLAKREMEEVVHQHQLGGLMKLEASAPTTPPSTLPLATPHIDVWQKYLFKNEQIVLSGLVVKKRYRFTDISAKNRHLILTDQPRLIYLDPETNLKRGEIPWSEKDLEVVLKDEPGSFDICTPHRTYILRDMLGDAKRWQSAIHALLGRAPTPRHSHSSSTGSLWWW